MKTYRARKSGFTLVEILIVVIILGILAAIVIPQFTNASQDARKSSLVSQLQTLRSQVELYKLQHRDDYPTDTGDLSAGAVWDWDKLTKQSDENGAVPPVLTTVFGPYLQSESANPIYADPATNSAMLIHNAEVVYAGAWPDAAYAWLITPSGKIFAASKLGTTVYDESDPNASTNDE